MKLRNLVFVKGEESFKIYIVSNKEKLNWKGGELKLNLNVCIFYYDDCVYI